MSRLRQMPWLTILTVVAACLAVAVPLLRAHVLPFVDYPEHLGTIAALHGQHDPLWSRWFTVDLGGTQYLGFYFLSHVLAFPLGVDVGTRLATVLGLASLPLAVALWLRAHGRPAILGALVAPVALNAFAFWGFVNYCSAMPLALLGLAAHARLLHDQRPRWLVAYAVAALATFYMHAQLFLFLGLATAAQALAAVPVRGGLHVLRRTGWTALAALPSLGAVLLWLRKSAVLDRGMDGGRAGVARNVAEGKVEFQPAADALHEFQAHALDVYRDHADDHLLILFGFLMLAAIALRGWTPPQAQSVAEPAEPPPPRTSGPEVVLALAVVGYLFAPLSYKLIAPINHRFAPLVLALLPALGPVRLPRRSAAAWALAAGCIGLGWQTARVHNAGMGKLADELGELEQALDHAAPGQRLMGLIYDRYSSHTHMPTWLHAHQYYQAWRGGLAAFGFAEFTISPLRYQPGQAPPPFPPRFEWTPERFDYGTYRDYFDWYLTRHAPGQGPRDIEQARRVRERREVDPTTRVDFGFYRGPLSEAPRLVFEGPRWTLWARALR